MPNFPPTRPAQWLDFAHAERWEVRKQHEALKRVLFKQQVQPLHVFLGAQRQRRQGLRFSTCEQRRAVDARQQSRLASNFADLVERPAIRAPLGLQHFLAEKLLAQSFKSPLAQFLLVFVVLGNCLQDLFLKRVH